MKIKLNVYPIKRELCLVVLNLLKNHTLNMECHLSAISKSKDAIGLFVGYP